MGSVKGEIDRIAGAKTDIKDAIEDCGVDVLDEDRIETYAGYIRDIPDAVFAKFNVPQVGNDNTYIKYISQTNGEISATTGDTTGTVTKDSTALITSGGVYTKVQEYLPLAGGTMTGQIKFAENTTTPHIIGNGSQLGLGVSSAGSQLVLEPRNIEAGTSACVRRSSSDAGTTLGNSKYPWAAIYASKLYGKATGLALSDNIVNSKSKDVVSNWAPLGTSIHYYGTADTLNYQPNTYGFVVNVTNNTREVHQLWMSQPGGTIYHRGGNGSGWNNSGTTDSPIYWKALLDSINYTSYINETNFPGLKKTGTVTSITAGAGLAVGTNSTGGTITTSGTINLASSGVAADSYGPPSNVTGSNEETMSVPYITVDTYGRITAASNKTYTAKNYYPTTFTWTGGTSAGPTGSLTGSGMTAVSFGAIPSASSSASGVVTNGTQTFAGNKTFNGTINCSAVIPRAIGYNLGSSNYPFNYGYINALYVDPSPTSSTIYITGLNSSSSSTNSKLHTSTGVKIISGTQVHASGGFFETSDERLKHFYSDLKVDLDKISQLPKKYFTWKDENNENLQIGTSAQAVQEIYPELVSEDEHGTLSVAYDKLSVVALAAIDKIYTEIKTLRSQNLELEDRINKLEKLLLNGNS